VISGYELAAPRNHSFSVENRCRYFLACSITSDLSNRHKNEGIAVPVLDLASLQTVIEAPPGFARKPIAEAGHRQPENHYHRRRHCPETATAQEAITGVAGLGWGVGSSGMVRKFCGVY
jgi:hypothetical protein